MYAPPDFTNFVVHMKFELEFHPAFCVHNSYIKVLNCLIYIFYTHECAFSGGGNSVIDWNFSIKQPKIWSKVLDIKIIYYKINWNDY